ncbi:MAG TPA: L,D-transpeptidase family protein [Mobilitalea sp.]|nr:L,D-transpeptidase family protein [Mobilitalea sp.]
MNRKNKLFAISLLLISLSLILAGCRGNPVSEPVNQRMPDITTTPATSSVSTAPNAVLPDPSSVLPAPNVVQSDPSVSQTSSTAVSTIEPADVSKDEGKIISLSVVFKTTSEKVYATANVNIRSSCSTKKANIITVLKRGESIKRIGFNKEWSKVLYHNKICYIKSAYLSLKKPSVTPTPEVTKIPAVTTTPSSGNSGGTNSGNTDTASTKESFVAKLHLNSKIDQLICVIGNGGTDCTVSFHKKDESGKWLQQFSTDGDCGSKGITYNKKEGDHKTPAGLFSFTMAFGLQPDPGAQLIYRQITEYDYWIDDTASPFYNTWVNSKETPGVYQSEHLIDHAPQYNYVMNINFNPDNTPGLGSAIFLHCYNSLGKTTGCIAIAEKYMKTLTKETDSSTRILIVPDSGDLAKY